MKGLTFILILTASVASGCANFRNVEAGDSTATAGADPKADVIAASRKIMATKSLSGKLVGEGQKMIRKNVEFVAPDRYHVNLTDETGAQIEMIIIGNDTYIKSGDSWSKLSGDIAPTPTFRNKFSDDVLNTISDVKFEGEETINGKQARVYSYKLVTKVGSFPVSQKIWVDKSSGLPIKSYEEYTDGVTSNLTTTYDAETPVAVELPVN